MCVVHRCKHEHKNVPLRCPTFNKRLVFRQAGRVTATTLPRAHAPLVVNRPQGRGRTRSGLSLYYYSDITQPYACIKSNMFLDSWCLFMTRDCLASFLVSVSLLLPIIFWWCFQIGRGHSRSREMFSTRDHVFGSCLPVEGVRLQWKSLYLPHLEPIGVRLLCITHRLSL